MKWVFIGIGVVVAAGIAGVIAALGKAIPRQNSDEIDGGVVKRYWTDMPEEIKSTEIETFHCEISLIAMCDVDDLGYRVYTLDASLCDGGVNVKYSWYDRHGNCDEGEYKADAAFMTRLQRIVKEYNFVQHNGYYHTVSGLPEMYGESLDIRYVGGERIYVHDNQDGFLPIEASRALLKLFGAVTKTENK